MAGSAKARTIFAVSFERRPKLLHAVSTELGIWVISSPKAGQADRMPFYERNTLASFGAAMSTNTSPSLPGLSGEPSATSRRSVETLPP